MTEKQIKRVHLVYSIIMALLVLVLAGWAIYSCLTLFKTGQEGEYYSINRITPHLIYFCIPLTVCIAAIIIGVVLNAVYHIDEKEPRAFISDKDLLKKLYKNLDLTEAPSTLTRVIRSQRGFRHAFLIVMIVNAIINAGSALVYIFRTSPLASRLAFFNYIGEQGKHWTTALDYSSSATPLGISEILPIIFTILSYAAVPFFVAIVYDVFAQFTYEKELEAVKAIYAHYAKMGIPVSKIKENESSKKQENVIWFDIKSNWVTIVKYAVLFFSITCIVVGIINGILDGKISMILKNAVDICFGCVGME